MYIWLDARPSAKRLDSTASLRRAPSELLAAYRAGQSHEAPCPHGNCMPFAPRVFPGFEVVQFLFCGSVALTSLRGPIHSKLDLWGPKVVRWCLGLSGISFYHLLGHKTGGPRGSAICVGPYWHIHVSDHPHSAPAATSRVLNLLMGHRLGGLEICQSPVGLPTKILQIAL